MKVVRHSVFETNSSAQHSIVVLKESIKSDQIDLPLSRSGTITLTESDLTFNRCPFMILSDFYNKMRFAIASLVGCNDDPGDDLAVNRALRLNEIENIVKSVNDDFNNFCFDTKYDIYYLSHGGGEIFYGTVKEVTDSNGKPKFIGTTRADPDVEYELTRHARVRTYFGYVETSSSLLSSFLSKYNISLKDFLLDNKYIVIIDGDEFNEWDNIIDTHLIDENQVQEYFDWDE